MELLCPAGSFPALKSAVNNGADAVYIGFKNETNARRFSGLNFDLNGIERAIDYARPRHVKIHVAVNTFADTENWGTWIKTIDSAVEIGVDVLIVADISLIAYIHENYPHQDIHLSVQASCTNLEAINFYRKAYGVKRVVLPRVLSLQQVKSLCCGTDVEIEVFGFGSLCIMSEGRCYLSSYLTSESPNNSGACSPAAYVEWQQKDNVLESRLNGIVIDRYNSDELAGYPTLCKGRFNVDNHLYHVLEEPVSLNSLALLPELYKEGISSIKLEGRQRSPAYVEKITRVWRQAIDRVMEAPDLYEVSASWSQVLNDISEGGETTLGAYHRSWR